MSRVTPVHRDVLPAGERLRLGAEVLATYLWVRWLMRGDDAERAVGRLREVAQAPQIEFEEGAELVAAWRLAHAVGAVLNRLPSDSRCLFRSLTLLRVLARRGIPQVLVIAVRPQPFAAHAWIEVAGQAMLPDADPGYERLTEI